jgi:hypothetical protein
MNDLQSHCLDKRYSPCVTNKCLQIAFMVMFAMAVVIVPSIATIKFLIL